MLPPLPAAAPAPGPVDPPAHVLEKDNDGFPTGSTVPLPWRVPGLNGGVVGGAGRLEVVAAAVVEVGRRTGLSDVASDTMELA